MTEDKQKIDLIHKLMEMELKGFREPGEVQIAKDGRVQKNFNEVIAHIYQRPNSVFYILTYNQTYGVFIQNIEKQNDHTKFYIITISESCETYSLSEVIYLDNPLIELKKNFEQSKL